MTGEPTTTAPSHLAPARFAFDADTEVEPAGGHRWRTAVTPRWSIGPYPNGGYVLCVALAAVRRELPHPDPFAVSAHFLSPAVHGPAEVAVEPVRAGRAHSTAEARLYQEGVERVRVLATYGDHTATSGPTVVLEPPPDLPPPEEDMPGLDGPMPNGLDPEIRRRFEARLTPRSAAFLRGRPGGRGEVVGWLRFADGRQPDTACLPLVADAMPPAVFDLASGGWVPTLEFTVLVRGRPAPGWMRCRFTTRVLMRGYLEEDGVVWDSRGDVVAQSRQLARLNDAAGGPRTVARA